MEPCDERTLQSMLNDGKLSPDCLIWTEGWAEWKPITTVTVPPVPADGSTAVWGPIVAFKTVLFHRYATLTGRASRSEYWWFILAESLGLLLLMFGAGFLVALADELFPKLPSQYAIGIGAFVTSLISVLIFFVIGLLLIIPNIAATVRRLHDAGYSGLFILLNLLPCVGCIILLLLLLLPSSQPNLWGTGPDKPTA